MTEHATSHGFTPGTTPFDTGDRCRVQLARYPCPYSREEHDPDLPPEDVDAFGRRRAPRKPKEDDVSKPPVARYKHTFTVYGNSHDEVQQEIEAHGRGGYLNDSEMEARDEWEVTRGTTRSVMEHTNPDMTPERYRAELDAWWQQRKTERRGKP